MKIIEASQLPSIDKVYLKKSILGYRVVYPIKNEDGSINWFNLLVGGKANLLFLIILLLVGYTSYLGVNELISNYKLVADNPCEFCSDCHAQCRGVITHMIPNSDLINYNLTSFNFTA